MQILDRFQENVEETFYSSSSVTNRDSLHCLFEMKC